MKWIGLNVNLYARYLCSRDALGRPIAARDDRVSCIQNVNLFKHYGTRYHCPFCPFLLFFEFRTGFWDETHKTAKTDKADKTEKVDKSDRPERA